MDLEPKAYEHPLVSSTNQFELTTLARVLTAQHRSPGPDEEPPCLQPLLRAQARQLRAVEETGDRESVMELSMLEALALQAVGDMDAAIASLSRALEIAEPGGYLRTFVDEGAPMGALLYEAARRGIRPTYVGLLLAALPDTDFRQDESPHRRGSHADLIEALSDREMDVLQRVSEGLSNREIAQRLFISPGTVKVHTNSNYGKLDVHSRTQAVAKARAFGILDPE